MQPNGLYCRFSTVVDRPTNWNMTPEDYIELQMQKAKIEAIETLAFYLRPFNEVVEHFKETNMTKDEFESFLKDVGYEEKQNESCNDGRHSY